MGGMLQRQGVLKLPQAGLSGLPCLPIGFAGGQPVCGGGGGVGRGKPCLLEGGGKITGCRGRAVTLDGLLRGQFGKAVVLSRYGLGPFFPFGEGLSLLKRGVLAVFIGGKVGGFGLLGGL